MEEIPSQEKVKILSEDTKLEDYRRHNSLTNHQLNVLEKFYLLGLTAQQQQVSRSMILREADTFTTNDTEIDDVGVHKMIQLKDQVPVQKNYNHIPKPLHREIKEYVEDLLNRDWIIPSESNYNLPVVAVHKKDGTLRLCCDY